MLLMNTYMLIELWMLLMNTYMLIELWMLLVIAYMSSDDELLVNAYMLSDWWWCGHIVCVNICIELSHMFMHTWLMVTDVDIQNVRQGVKSYIRCVCCIEGDDLEVIWYRMHLEESRTLHAFEWLVKHVIIVYVTLWIVRWWNLLNVVIGVYVHWWTLLMVVNKWFML